jgi:hypothetical protein
VRAAVKRRVVARASMGHLSPIIARRRARVGVGGEHGKGLVTLGGGGPIEVGRGSTITLITRRSLTQIQPPPPLEGPGQSTRAFVASWDAPPVSSTRLSTVGPVTCDTGL